MQKGQTLPESRKKDTLRERLLTANNKLKQANFEIEQLKKHSQVNREKFSARALQGLLSNSVMGDSALWDSPQEWVKQMTESSVEMADSLLKELSK